MPQHPRFFSLTPDGEITLNTAAMTAHLLTPSPSREPKSETPASLDGAMDLPLDWNIRKRRADFSTCQHNERAAIRTHIEKFIQTDGKARIMAYQDKWAFLLQKRDEKVLQRIEQYKDTMEKTFPDMYSEKSEQEWLKKAFRLYLDGDGGRGWRGREEEDRDDEEPLPPIKKEDGDDEEGHLERSAQRSRSEIMSYLKRGGVSFPGKKLREQSRKQYEERSDEEDEREKKPAKREVGVACSRSFAILHGCAGLDVKKRGGEDVEDVKGTAGPRGQVDPVNITTRGWRVVDGKLIVWPPFGATPSSGAGTISKKRKVEESSAGGAEKKVKICG